MAINFFSEDQQDKIVQAIQDAEKDTSGEIKVHLELKCPGDVIERAKEVFNSLDMHKTQLRNGVLIYVALDDHKFAIIGDAGIHSVVSSDFWRLVKDHMRARFKQGLFTEGLCEGIQMAGQQLKAYFPYQSGDKNELSDDISFGTT